MQFKYKQTAAILLSAAIGTAGISVAGAAPQEAAQPAVKNVIILIPDGMSVGGTTLTRWYKGAPLALDEMASGLVRTYSADAAIADSAPAGSAFANGHKSHTGFVGVLPDVANMPGEIMHATPADFSAHYPDRSNYDALSEQQVYAGMDVVLGGGGKFFASENRKDKENLISEIERLGYDYLTTPQELKSSNASKIWGMFAPGAMAYEMDRSPEKEPSLAEMTQKAIDVLSKNDNGFFLMVEGSKVDWAAHANDPVGIISDVLSFDDAVKVALDYAKANQDTAIVAVTDHGNGGLTIGNKDTTKTYDKEPLSTFLAPLQKAKLTGEGLESVLNADRSNIKEVMAEYFGITDLTDAEAAAIKSTKAGSLNYTVGPMISDRARIGWTTGGHTGEDVVLYSYSPNGDRPMGVIENTDVAKYMARMLNVSLDETTKQLFVPARGAFEAKGASVTWEDNQGNSFITVTKGTTTLKLHVFKNIAELNGQAVQLKGNVIFNGINAYVPQDAVDLIH
ncbi:MAG: alkaline phosphatase [Paenibacillaceae bacterium]|nr:alkaline phosphatase [Paenibacillaceae bacterium]